MSYRDGLYQDVRLGTFMDNRWLSIILKARGAREHGL
jgi:hypothetical protein